MSKQLFYAVQKGRVPGVYRTWDECKAQVDGFPNAKYKKFVQEKEAQDFVKGNIVETIQPKVKRAVTANRELSENPIVDGPYAFVDGSFNPKTNVYGYGGFVCVDGRKYPVMGHGDDPEMAAMRNVSGEIEGAMAAVRKAEELKIRELTILYDYKGIEQWAIPEGQPGHWKTTKDGTKAYAEFMRPENRLTCVKFYKVDGHTGIEGNEMADVMAKTAVGVVLTKPEQALFEQAMKCGRREGVPGFEDVLDKEPSNMKFLSL